MNFINTSPKILLLGQCLLAAACATVVGADNKAMIDLKKVDMIRYTQDLKFCQGSVKNHLPASVLETEPKVSPSKTSQIDIDTITKKSKLTKMPSPIIDLDPVIGCLLERGYTLVN